MADVTTLADGTRFNWDAPDDDINVTEDAAGAFEVVSQARKIYQRYGLDVATELDARAKQRDNVASLQATAGVDGEQEMLLGFTTPGDAGDPWGMIYRATGRTGIDLANGRYVTGPGADDYWESTARDRAIQVVAADGSLSNFYAPTGAAASDWEAQLELAFTEAIAGDEIHLPHAAYMESSSPISTTLASVYGHGSTIKFTTVGGTAGVGMIAIINAELHDLTIVGPGGTGVDIYRAVKTSGAKGYCENVTVRDMPQNSGSAGFGMFSSEENICKNCTVINGGYNNWDFRPGVDGGLALMEDCISRFTTDYGDGLARHVGCSVAYSVKVIIRGGLWTNEGAFDSSCNISSTDADGIYELIEFSNIAFDFKQYVPYTGNLSVGIFKLGRARRITMADLDLDAPGTAGQMRTITDGHVDKWTIDRCRIEGELVGSSGVDEFIIRDSVIGARSHLDDPTTSPRMQQIVTQMLPGSLLRIERCKIYGLNVRITDADLGSKVRIVDTDIYWHYDSLDTVRYARLDNSDLGLDYYGQTNVNEYVVRRWSFTAPDTGTQAEFAVGDTTPSLPGATPAGDWEVVKLNVTSGSWGGNDAAGDVWMRALTTTYYAGTLVDADFSNGGRVKLTFGDGGVVYQSNNSRLRLQMTALAGDPTKVYWDDQLHNGAAPGNTAASWRHPAYPDFNSLTGVLGDRVINKNYPNSTTKIPYWEWDDTNSLWAWANGSAATTAQLEDATHAVNTAGKYEGKWFFNTDTGKPAYASGSGTTAVWNDSAGTLAHTPV